MARTFLRWPSSSNRHLPERRSHNRPHASRPLQGVSGRGKGKGQGGKETAGRQRLSKKPTSPSHFAGLKVGLSLIICTQASPHTVCFFAAVEKNCKKSCEGRPGYEAK